MLPSLAIVECTCGSTIVATFCGSSLIYVLASSFVPFFSFAYEYEFEKSCRVLITTLIVRGDNFPYCDMLISVALFDIRLSSLNP